MKDNSEPIGVFDSGVGGISVLAELVKLMPNENFIYLGDSANAPYGSRPTNEIEALVLENAAELMKQNCKALVIACNTATAAAIKALRQLYAGVPIIGIEPALKPAVEAFPGGHILVMATEATLKEQKYLDLKAAHSHEAEIISLPAPGLADYVELGDLHSEALETFLRTILKPYSNTDALVLGCTHYPFVKDMLIHILGSHVLLTDGGAGTARETLHQLQTHGIAASDSQKGTILFQNSLPEKAALSEELLTIIGR